MRGIKSLLFILATVVLVFSCTQKQIVKHYFILGEDRASEDSLYFAQPLPFSVQISSINIMPAYNQTRIALRSKSHELRYYYYNLWAERPSQAIRFFIFTRLKQSNLFQRCISDIGATTPDYTVNGYVEQLERVHLPDNYFAHLRMRLELIDVTSNRAVASRRIDRRVPLKENSPMNDFAAAISKILQEETNTFFSEIYQTLKNHSHEK